MPRIQPQITPHMKNEKNLNSHEKIQSTGVNAEMTQMLELSDKDFKAAILQRTQKSNNE